MVFVVFVYLIFIFCIIFRYTRTAQFTVKYGELSTYSLSSSMFLILLTFPKCMDAEIRGVYQKRGR
ncbi:hypothetical protein AHAS_Ahas08G0064100 [Arachis hypogaea]